MYFFYVPDFRQDGERASLEGEDNEDEEDEDEEESSSRNRTQSPSSTTDEPNGSSHSTASHPIKPRIWSLADLAASPTQPSESGLSIAGKIGFHRPLHLDSSPYGRPLNPPRLTTPQEALLQVYAKTLGLSCSPYSTQQPPPSPQHPFPPPGFAVLPSPLHHPLPVSLTSPPSLHHTISRPLATRALLHLPSTVSIAGGGVNHLLPGGARVVTAPSSSTWNCAWPTLIIFCHFTLNIFWFSGRWASCVRHGLYCTFDNLWLGGMWVLYMWGISYYILNRWAWDNK